MARLTTKTNDGRYILEKEIIKEFPPGSGLRMPTQYLCDVIDKLGYYEDLEEENLFEIKPGIIISKLDIKPGETILITVDTDIWDIETTQHIMDLFQKWFPNNNIVCTLKGFDIIVKKNAGAGTNLK